MTALSNEDILYILELIKKADFEFFELETGELKLTVSKTGFMMERSEKTVGAPHVDHSQSAATEVNKSAASLEASTNSPTSVQPPKNLVIPDGLIPVTAPMVGTFYTAPEPGAPPFVKIGSHVDEETTLGLIEVMKVFNSVQARVRGIIDEILVQNGQFVEYGQPLFLVKPKKSKERKKSPST